MARIVQRTVAASALAALPSDLPPLLRRIYAARGVDSASARTALAELVPVSELRGAAEAANRLASAYASNERVLVVGDFDADGATASALMMRCLESFGFSHVGYRVPDRFRFGYGLSVDLVEELAGGRPDVIVTVDNGISSIDGVLAARAHGIDVIITDHHIPGEHLPAAAVTVNPMLEGNPAGLKSLAGVGVAFYVMAALGQLLADKGILDAGQARRICAACLDLVALGTVADLVPLDRNNRVLVAQGLARIRGGSMNPGLAALFAVAGRDPANATASDLGFAIGPRLNAAGRLTDMGLGIECLRSQDPAAALELAGRLSVLNGQRQQMQAEMQNEANQIVDLVISNATASLPAVLCLYEPGWHQGVVGLVASRIKDRLGRPVFAFAPGESEGLLKGSGRSITGVHLRDLLARVDATHPGLIRRFGGHAMAAGLSIDADCLSGLQDALQAAAPAWLAATVNETVLQTDGELAATEFDLATAEMLRFAAPWGQGFPEPMFHGEFEVLAQRIVGGSHLQLRLRVDSTDVIIGAIAFNAEPLSTDDFPARCRLVFRLDVNQFQGRRQPQLVVEHLECV